LCLQLKQGVQTKNIESFLQESKMFFTIYNRFGNKVKNRFDTFFPELTLLSASDQNELAEN